MREPAPNSFEVVQKFIPSIESYDEQFGRSISISGDRLLIGSNDREIGGRFYGVATVYEKSGDDWVETATLLPDGTDEDYSIGADLDGDTAVIGVLGRWGGFFV